MTALDWDTAQHVDVVCPPAQDAVCGHCGEQLADHDQLVDPDAPLVPAEAGCRDDAYLAWRAGRDQTRFELAAGETLDCPNVMACHCGAEICSDHSSEFTTCAGSTAVLHHHDCADWCEECQWARHQDSAEDRAIEQWKGMW